MKNQPQPKTRPRFIPDVPLHRVTIDVKGRRPWKQWRTVYRALARRGKDSRKPPILTRRDG